MSIRRPLLFVGDDVFTFTVSDGTTTSTAIAVIHVTDTAPMVTNAYYYDSHNQTLIVPNTSGLLSWASDAEHDSLSVVAINGSTTAVGSTITTSHGGTLTVQANGSFVYTPAQGFTGDDTFTFTISDGILTTTATATIHVA